MSAGFTRWVRENSLSVALFGCFGIFLICLSFTGQRHYNEEARTHGQTEVTYTEYLRSGDFVEAVFENWESEFLQMWALVVLTVYLRQKGSADSKKLRGKTEVDTQSRYSIIHARSWRTRTHAVADLLRGHALSAALLSIFFVSFALHAAGGTHAYNHEALAHHQEPLSVVQYVRTSQFWFESFQNWQSEFLAVGALLVLSVFLRERGSPESKAIGERDSTTG